MLKVQRLLRQRWQVLLAMLALVLGLALVGFFGVRAWHQYEYAHRVASGAVRVESLRGWMTLPYIEKAYGVPEQELRTALGLPSEGFETRSLRDWFHAAQMDPDEGRRRIEALILSRSREAGVEAAVPADTGRDSGR